MRHWADRLVEFLLSRAAWYRPAQIDAREARTERVRQRSIRGRIAAEKAEERMQSELNHAERIIRR
jgi:hypothetical protein